MEDDEDIDGDGGETLSAVSIDGLNEQKSLNEFWKLHLIQEKINKVFCCIQASPPSHQPIS